MTIATTHRPFRKNLVSKILRGEINASLHATGTTGSWSLVAKTSGRTYLIRDGFRVRNDVNAYCRTKFGVTPKVVR